MDESLLEKIILSIEEFRVKYNFEKESESLSKQDGILIYFTEGISQEEKGKVQNDISEFCLQNHIEAGLYNASDKNSLIKSIIHQMNNYDWDSNLGINHNLEGNDDPLFYVALRLDEDQEDKFTKSLAFERIEPDEVSYRRET